MLSTDQNILKSGTEAQKRMLDYGGIFDELHIIIYTMRQGLRDKGQMTIADNVFVYPTNSLFKPVFFWHAYKIAKKIIIDSRFQISDSVITAQDPFETGLVGWLLKRRFQLPLQIQIHADIFSPYFWEESLKNKLRVLLAKFLLPKADGIRVVSERIKNSLVTNRQSLVAKITVLPIFVDVRKIQNKKPKIDLRQKYPDYKFIFLMASRLTREKNIGLAIEAAQEVVKKYPKTLFLIVGEGPEQKNLQLLITNYQLRNNVIIEPWTEDLISYYKIADLFLLTSNYEGYGRTVVEAMAAGLPVIMTDVGLAGELLIDELDGGVVPVNDKEALIKTIGELLENQEKREGLIQEAQKIIESLMPKNEYLRLYKESLENMPKPKPKLAYILSKYQENDPTHFAHLHDFIKRIVNYFNLFLIVERGIKPPADFGYQRARLARLSVWPILYARFSGYKNFYVHYSFGAAFWASLITRLFGGRVFYWNCGEPWKYHRSFFREIFEKSVYKLITFLVTGTESIAKGYSRHYGIPIDKIKIMPNWINLDSVKRQVSSVKVNELKQQLNIAKDAKVILFVHRLSKRKGAHYLPEILNNLRSENVVLIIIGDGPERSNIQLQIANYKLQDKVRFLGWVPNREILNYFTIADLFIMPSEEEGFPRVLLESMVMGIPFVANNVGDVSGIIPAAMRDYVVKTGDTRQFTVKIKELLFKNPRELAKMKDLLMDGVKQYDISIIIKIFVDILQ